jgi:hypothetical protein
MKTPADGLRLAVDVVTASTDILASKNETALSSRLAMLEAIDRARLP